MSQISAKLVKELRDRTGAGMMDCKKALQDNEGNIDQAIDYLRKKGLKNVEKRAGKVAAEGVCHSYIHGEGRIGVMLELNCETDFVARGDDFLDLARAISMHIAWASPRYVSSEEIPESEINSEREIYRSQLTPQQEKVADKIIDGKIEKFYESVCLLNQIDAKEPTAKKSIGDLVTETSAKLGEKITVRRFVRYEVGEGIEKSEVDFAQEVADAAKVS